MAKRNFPTGGAVPMDPGSRDKHVTVLQLTSSVGSSNYPVESWPTLARVWMFKDDQRASERFKDGQLSAPSLIRWEMGYRADMDPELLNVPKTRRLSYQGRGYDIVDASVIGRREGIELTTIDGKKAA